MLSAEVFDARLPRANLVTKTDFDDKLNVLSNKLTQIEQNIFLVENESKKPQIFIQFVYVTKAILKKIAHKLI